MNRFYLVRHGENQANLTKEFSHRKIDYPLTPKGRLQAEQTALYFQEASIHEIYTSPLKRAVETAAIIAQRQGIDYTIMENFREINVGDLEELPVSAEVWQRHDKILDDWLTGAPQSRFPGGEDYYELWRRMRVGIERIASGKQDQNILIVGHGGIFTLTLKDLCPGVDLKKLRQKESHNCSFGEILIQADNGYLEGQLVSWAYNDHLHGEAAQFVSGSPDTNTFQKRDDTAD